VHPAAEIDQGKIDLQRLRESPFAVSQPDNKKVWHMSPAFPRILIERGKQAHG